MYTVKSTESTKAIKEYIKEKNYIHMMCANVAFLNQGILLYTRECILVGNHLNAFYVKNSFPDQGVCNYSNVMSVKRAFLNLPICFNTKEYTLVRNHLNVVYVTRAFVERAL